MSLALEPYAAQERLWPQTGRHILAQFDEETIVVYQAYRPEIGHYAATHGKLGGGFSFGRMTWIKPNFLWMMFRSGWGTKPDQEVTLAIRVRRANLEEILSEAVPSSPGSDATHEAREEWKEAVARSSVRLQWDPDHDPSGAALERRALQLGLRGDALRRFAEDGIVSIEDISALVAEQRGRPRAELVVPRERVYPVPEGLRTPLRITEP